MPESVEDLVPCRTSPLALNSSFSLAKLAGSHLHRNRRIMECGLAVLMQEAR
jgi:hypothetical protein